MERVTALFQDRHRAEQAIEHLRAMGISDSKLSIVGSNGEEIAGEIGEMMNKDVTAGATRGLTVGASAGVLFGIAAALIPGVGPFITAGALATSLGAVAGGAVAGAVVGGTAGSLAGAFSQAGYEKDEADFYGQAVHQGEFMVAVDAADAVEARSVRSVLDNSSAKYYQGMDSDTMSTNQAAPPMTR